MLNERGKDKLIRKAMRKVVLKWDKLSVPLKIQKMRFVTEKMSANAAIFPNPNPDLATLAVLTKDLDQAETAASEGGKDRTRARDAALRAATEGMNLQVLYVHTVTLGDPDMTALAGMETQSVPQPWPEPHRPTGFKVKPGKLEGSVYMSCKGTKYKKEYVFEMWVEPVKEGLEGTWVPIQSQTSGRYQHEGLERGKIYRFRVYAKNSKGRSMASSEASCAAK